MLIDTHLHLSEYKDISKVIDRAIKNDVKYLIVSGSDFSDNKWNMSLLEKYDNIFLTCGYHPECIDYKEDDLKYLEECIKNDRVVAIGEIGLDYHYGKDNMEKQKELFKKQLDIAEKYNLPVVIHTRDAFLDTYNILKEYNLKGVIHCFSGSLEVAQKYISLGYYLGIGGVITFKNSNLKDVVKKIGADKILFETDSPYLSPYRGMENEPCNVKVICEFTSDILGISPSKLSKITSDNAIRLFDLESKI